MAYSRRQFIRLGGAAAAVGAASAALPGAAPLAARPALRWSARLSSQMPEPDLAALLLNRAAFGPRPGELEHARDIGPASWIEEQLDYEAIDDSALEEELHARLQTLSMTPGQLLSYSQNMQGLPTQEMILATLYRMTYSPRMLYEAMVEFWNDHFSIYVESNDARYLKPVDDREVARKHALGTFKDLLTASAQSPAMLNYLDNDQNRVRSVNENYGREIMELHSLGVAVDGYPYSEQDVKEVALCFTGWGVSRDQRNPARYGRFEYNDAQHDQTSKRVLGNDIGAGMKQLDGHMVIDILVQHEATARYIATKLIRRFVTDDPAGQVPALLDRVADTFQRTSGDLRETVRAILRSTEFAQSFGQFGGRLSRPVDLVVRQLRVTGVPRESFPIAVRDGGIYNKLNAVLSAMGHRPFYWETPDGYPDVKEAWSSSTTMLWRWNFGLALSGNGERGGRLGQRLIEGFTPDMAAGVPATFANAGTAADYWITRLLQRPMAPADRTLVVDYLTDGGSESAPFDQVKARVPNMIALILDSPYFQWR